MTLSEAAVAAERLRRVKAEVETLTEITDACVLVVEVRGGKKGRLPPEEFADAVTVALAAANAANEVATRVSERPVAA